VRGVLKLLILSQLGKMRPGTYPEASRDCSSRAWLSGESLGIVIISQIVAKDQLNPKSYS